ncbi:MAG: hypothetical protein AAB152_18270 [Candidatus Coatesbacteria bacterium]
MRHATAALLLALWAHPASGAEPQALAVLDFQPTNAPAGDAGALMGFVRSAFVRSGTFAIVDKANMDRILQEPSSQRDGCTTPECAVKLGRMLNVNRIVVGEYTVMGTTRVLTASLVSVDTGRIEQTAQVRGFDLDSADVAANTIVARLLAGVAAPPAPYPASAGGTSILKRGIVEVGVGPAFMTVGQRMRFGEPGAVYGSPYGTRAYALGVDLPGTQLLPGISLDLEGRLPVNEAGNAGIGVGVSSGVLRSPPAVTGKVDYSLWESGPDPWVGLYPYSYLIGLGRAKITAVSSSTPVFVKPAAFIYLRVHPRVDVTLGASSMYVGGLSRKATIQFDDGTTHVVSLPQRGGIHVTAFQAGAIYRLTARISLAVAYDTYGSQWLVNGPAVNVTNTFPMASLSVRYRL